MPLNITKLPPKICKKLIDSFKNKLPNIIFSTGTVIDIIDTYVAVDILIDLFIEIAMTATKKPTVNTNSGKIIFVIFAFIKNAKIINIGSEKKVLPQAIIVEFAFSVNIFCMTTTQEKQNAAIKVNKSLAHGKIKFPAERIR